MGNRTHKALVLSYVFQFLAAVILFYAAYQKLVGSKASIYIFESLGIGESRMLIATIEGLAAILLLTKSFPHYGAILGFGTMLGALIAHISVLGLNVDGDGGSLVVLMLVLMISTLLVMLIRRRNLPFIGRTL